MPFRSVFFLLLSSLTIVNDGLLLTIVNETTNFLKTVVFENDRFEKQPLFKTISNKNDRFVFRRRFYNETIVLKKWKRSIPTSNVASSLKNFREHKIILHTKKT